MPVLAVLGAHWGDEGKGKIAAALSRDAHVCARFQGGPNAAHSVLAPGRTEPWVLRMVPSGILSGAVGVVGGGCVIEPRMLLNEVAALRAAFPDVTDRLRVSLRAHVITAEHREADRSGSGVGSTRMGVGLAYRDKAARTGLRVRDLLAGGDRLPADLRPVAEEFADLLGGCCVDEVAYLRDRLDAGARVVAEGAQGSRLDLDHGDYPYVTSSNTTVGAVLTGLGVGPRDIASVLLVTPAYVTKVGGGELPSRLYGELNAELQERGEELDRATDLMRDTGWLDVGWLRAACRLNQADGIVMTKFDVLAGFPSIGLYDADRNPAVRMVPGWSAEDVATASGGSEAPYIAAYLAEVERRCATPVVAAGRGQGLDDWWWRGDEKDLWRSSNQAMVVG
ncbi:adenylosuccinate synthetase [Streptosporangium saharense]|uniref:adenylosuccinate synthetase n=1 Tax=Streptosporangium saharense TaxID=1706840 RepID=UPI003688F85D